MSGIAQWWDGVELWVAGLPFVPQAVLALGVLVPLAALVATGLDRLVGGAFTLADRFGPTRGESPARAADDYPARADDDYPAGTDDDSAVEELKK